MLQVKYIMAFMGEPVDIIALLFGGYTSFILLDKWFYIVNWNLTFGTSLMSQLDLTLFPLCNVICCSISN